MTDAATRLHPAPAWTVLAVTPVLVAAVVVTGSPVVAALVVVLALASAWVGGARNLVSPVLRWSLLGAAVAFTASEVARQVGLTTSRQPPAFVVTQAVLALAAYLAGLVFVAVMVRRVAHRAGPVIWLDAGIIATGSVIVAWRYVLTPAVASGGEVTAAALQMVYIGFDALILGLVIQLTVRKVARTPAFWIMLAGFTSVLVINVSRGLEFAGVVDRAPVLAVDGASVAAFCLLAALSLHPSVAELRDEPADGVQHARPARLAISYLALVAPTVVLLEDRAGGGLEHHLRAGLYVALVTAVFFRMAVATSRLLLLQGITTYRADHDALTGLLNRAATLSALQSRMTAGDGDLHVLFVDADKFKTVNDTWGHAVGDSVLRQAAGRLREAAGPDAVVGRVGGDEFVLGATGDPVVLAERVRSIFARPYAHPDGGQITVTCSVGVATERSQDAGSLVSDADVAMYAAKGAARNSVRRFTAADRATLALEAYLRQELEGAVERDEIHVHLQPLVDVVDGRTAGYEALLRWTTRDGSSIPPDQLIPVAESAGLMRHLDDWVLAESCRHLQRLRAELGGDLFVSVNLTTRQLADPDLPSTVDALLERHDLPPHALWLELTEATMVRDVVGTQANVMVLREAGVVVALDDFGTGYASLSHLHELRCQVVKIDRSFVHHLDDPGSDEAIVASIVAMSHALGLTVVAEGVETTAQADRLRRLRVDFLQGYLFGRPVPLDDVLAAAHPPREIDSASSAPLGRP